MPTERRLELADRLPRCRVTGPRAGGLLSRVPDWRGRLVLDHGCGDAHRRAAVEDRGATYVGLDPYSSSSDLHCAGEEIPLADASVDVVISNAVLHLVPHPWRDVAEIGRVLKPGGAFVGYVGFLEGDAEAARFLFSHLALSETLQEAGLELEEISVGAYGIDLQAGNLLVPFGTLPPAQRAVRVVVRELMGAWMSLLSHVAGGRHARRRGLPADEARRTWRTWLDVAHAAGFEFTARKPGAGEAVSGPAPFDWTPLLRCPRSGAPLRRVERDGTTFLQSKEWAYPVRGRQLHLSAAEAVALR